MQLIVKYCMLVLSMGICGFEVRDPCKIVLEPFSAPLFNDFIKEADEKSPDLDMLAPMEKKIGCNL